MGDEKVSIEIVDDTDWFNQLQNREYEPFPHYLAVVQFSLRMLGVYATAVGGTYLLQNAVELYVFEPPIFERPIQAALLGNAAYTLFGIYLAVSGRWVIENVFLPARTSSDELEQTETAAS